MEKDTVIRETARLMGYARTGKLIADSIERGIAYGRKTGEIVLTPEKKFKLAE